MKKLTRTLFFAILSALSLSVSAQDIEYRTYNGIRVGNSGPIYLAYSGVYTFDGEMTEVDFDFPLGDENSFDGGIAILYNKDEMDLSLVPEGEFSDVLDVYMTDYAEKHPGATFMSRIILSNYEDFACPAIIEGGSIAINVSHATCSSKVEEIGTGQFNTWSTLKYLTSRLMKHKIIGIEFACDGPDSELTVLCNINVDTNGAEISLAEAIMAIAKASGDHEFYKYGRE